MSHYELLLLARRYAIQTMLLVAVAKKIGLTDDPEMAKWLEVMDNDACKEFRELEIEVTHPKWRS